MRLLLLILSSCLSWAASAAAPHQHAEQYRHQHHSMQTPPANARDPFAWSDPQAPLITPHHPTKMAALIVHHLEWQPQQEQFALDATAWVGTDDQRWIVRADVEKPVFDQVKQTWSVHLWQPIDAFWNREMGLVWTDESVASQGWLSVGITGLSPYWVELGAWLWLEPDGQTQWRVDAEYEARLNQTWAFYPAVHLKAYGQDRADRQQWAGLAEWEMNLRLAYQPQRWLAPYLGVGYTQPLGTTAKRSNEAHDEWQGLLGVRFWY